MTRPAAYLGIDLGTSGCRGVAIDAAGQVLAEHAIPLPAPTADTPGHSEQSPALWWQATCDVLRTLAGQLSGHEAVALAVDGTSATLICVDDRGDPIGPALMYDDSRARPQAERLASIAPADAAVHAPTSSLAKLLWLTEHGQTKLAAGVLHQAEWLAAQLTGQAGEGDENNCLKLGYDPVSGGWPAWLGDTGIDTRLLPQVFPAGEPRHKITPTVARMLGLPDSLTVTTGTTDSVAAALACGLDNPGDGATALGSSLAIKLLSPVPVFSPAHGVYSHRILGHWLAGGASNSGGRVLRQYFSDARMAELTPRLRPDQPTGLDYYPLPAPGERFPINDPDLAPRITPVPDDPVRFFQGLLEGIADIEAQGYARLAALGAPQVRRVQSTGGGARNPAWTRMREKHLGVPVSSAAHEQAAYGAALLARAAVRS